MIYVTHAKPSVKFDVIAPAGFRILAKIDDLSSLLKRDVFISCGTEGHGPDDPHTTGQAYDLSVVGWTGQQIEDCVNYLRHELGPLFYVQFEVRAVSEDGTPSRIAVQNHAATAPHIHAQRKKGTTYPPSFTVNT